MNIKVGTVVTVQIEELASSGEGKSSVGDKMLLVPGATPGDILEVRIRNISRQSNRIWADIVNVIKRGETFKTPECKRFYPLHGFCGGCQIMHLDYKRQKEFKFNVIRKAFWDCLKLDLSSLAPKFFLSPSLYYYRNRSNYVVDIFKSKVYLGSYSPRSNKFARMDECFVVKREIEDNRLFLGFLLNDLGVPVYPRRKDGVRWVVIRSNYLGEVLIDFIVSAVDQPRWLNNVVKRRNELRRVVGISWSSNTSSGNAIRIAPSINLWGRKTVVEKIAGLSLEIGPDTFFQLNSDIASLMYSNVARFASDYKGIVWDLFCGVGGVGIAIAKMQGGFLFGAEVWEPSIRLAKINAFNNDVEGKFVTLDLQSSVPSDWEQPTIVVINPPRKGVDDSLIEKLIEVKSRLLIYISCNPISMVRDIKKFLDNGYNIIRFDIYDMLPHTVHIESVAYLVLGG